VEKSVEPVENGSLNLTHLTLGEIEILKRYLKRTSNGSNGYAFATHAPADIVSLLKTNNELRKNLLKQSGRVNELEAELAQLKEGANVQS